MVKQPSDHHHSGSDFLMSNEDFPALPGATLGAPVSRWTIKLLRRDPALTRLQFCFQRPGRHARLSQDELHGIDARAGARQVGTGQERNPDKSRRWVATTIDLWRYMYNILYTADALKITCYVSLANFYCSRSKWKFHGQFVIISKIWWNILRVRWCSELNSKPVQSRTK